MCLEVTKFFKNQLSRSGVTIVRRPNRVKRRRAPQWLLVGALVTGAASAGDDGRQAYLDHCAKCHGVVSERRTDASAAGRFMPVVALPLGPNLTGIHGRPAGTVEGFRYSDAFVAAAPGIVWTDESLERWLADSQAMIPGSYMFVKLEPDARRKVIGYLRTFAAHRPR